MATWFDKWTTKQLLHLSHSTWRPFAHYGRILVFRSVTTGAASTNSQTLPNSKSSLFPTTFINTHPDITIPSRLTVSFPFIDSVHDNCRCLTVCSTSNKKKIPVPTPSQLIWSALIRPNNVPWFLLHPLPPHCYPHPTHSGHTSPTFWKNISVHNSGLHPCTTQSAKWRSHLDARLSCIYVIFMPAPQKFCLASIVVLL